MRVADYVVKVIQSTHRARPVNPDLFLRTLKQAQSPHQATQKRFLSSRVNEQSTGGPSGYYVSQATSSDIQNRRLLAIASKWKRWTTTDPWLGAMAEIALSQDNALTSSRADYSSTSCANTPKYPEIPHFTILDLIEWRVNLTYW